MRTRTVMAAALCALALSAVTSIPGSASERNTDIPLNIAVAPPLRAVVDQMLKQSRTFRGQCGILARARNFRIQIGFEQRPEVIRIARAQTEVARHEYGAVNASVRVWTGGDTPELIAHEFEHLIELAEGINYRLAAVLTPGQVWATKSGAYETNRAIEIGLRVKQETSAIGQVGR